MSIERLDPHTEFAHRDSCAPRVPRCYSRCAASQLPLDRENNSILIALSILTCIATFLVVYRYWSF